MGITLINPKKTLPISVTGNKCALRCKHCNAKYLNHMVSIYNLSQIDVSRYSSFLVSGGSNKEGVVEFRKEHFEILSNYKHKKNFHTGLINDEAIVKDIVSMAEAISLDIVFDTKTINYVYNLNKDKMDYKKTLELFLKYSSKVFPHITIGLNGGKLSHEFESINLLSHYDFKAVVFLVLIPTKNTFFEKTEYTKIEDVESVLKYAKSKLESKLILGCMKPHGSYGEMIDIMSRKYVDSIVKPAKSIGKVTNEECCVLSYV